MNESEVLEILKEGEGITVEFKKSTTSITKDVYDTVCSFSNREGGHIFLGVANDGSILGIAPYAINQVKSEFVTTINNPNKIFPPLYLKPEVIEVDKEQVIHIYVPVGTGLFEKISKNY